ncbi:MAG: MEDS domain-containing protein [Actinomycetota bacterium]
MAPVRTLHHAAGLRAADHACWAYTSHRGFVGAAVTFLAEGGQLGERLLYVGTMDDDELTADLAALPERDAWIAEGRLSVHHLDDVYDPQDRSEPAAQVELFRKEAAAAVAEGFSGLRVVADVTNLAESPEDLNRMAAYELSVDGMIAANPVTGLCAYDERRVGERIGALAAMHTLQHRTGKPASFAVTLRGSTLTVTGEIDSMCADDLHHALDAVQDVTDGPLRIDLSSLDFIDVAGTRTLARAVARMVDDGRELRVHGARSASRRCLELFGLDVVDEGEEAAS